MRIIFFVFFLIATAACSQKGDKVNSGFFLPGQVLGELTNKNLREASGIAASANNPGLIWTHNDSGNGPEIFLVDKDLNVSLTCRLNGALNRDWEDIAVGPGPEPGKNYVYVADIGDNLKIFQYKTIYRFEEPVAGKARTEITISEFDTITFSLSDEIRDTESLMINPITKNIYIISKNKAPVYLYELKFPQTASDTIIAERLIPLPFSNIVSAGFSTDGKEVIIKNQRNVYYWKVNDLPAVEALKTSPYIVEYKEEPQGEAITFARDGSGFYTLSEKVKGEKTHLYFYPRKK